MIKNNNTSMSLPMLRKNKGNNGKVNPSSDQSLISPNNITFQSSIEGFENKRNDRRN